MESSAFAIKKYGNRGCSTLPERTDGGGYNNGRSVVQNISVRDNQGDVRTTNLIGGKLLT